MAATGTPTPNIGLRIPQGTDPASVDDINYNSNLLDTKLGAVGNTSVQDQIDSLNGNKATKDAVQLTNGTAVTYTFQDNTAFILLIERANTTGVGYSGLYIGHAHNSGHVVAVYPSSSCTVSINARTLTLTASATNMEARIITFSY